MADSSLEGETVSLGPTEPAGRGPVGLGPVGMEPETIPGRGLKELGPPGLLGPRKGGRLPGPELLRSPNFEGPLVLG